LHTAGCTRQTTVKGAYITTGRQQNKRNEKLDLQLGGIEILFIATIYWMHKNNTQVYGYHGDAYGRIYSSLPMSRVRDHLRHLFKNTF